MVALSLLPFSIVNVPELYVPLAVLNSARFFASPTDIFSNLYAYSNVMLGAVVVNSRAELSLVYLPSM